MNPEPRNSEADMRKSRINNRIYIICLTLCIFAVISACSSQKAETSKKSVPQGQKKLIRPVPVTAAQVMPKSIPLEIRAVGNIESFSTVQVKSRVTGELQKVHFREGQDVAKGDLLFTIDPRPFEAVLSEARAKLERDRALFRKAEEDNRRYENLFQGGFISKEQYDQARTNLNSLHATLAADEAVVENARLQLGYTSIYSPISGRTGSILIDRGNMIKANDDNKSMVVIEQINPIYASFAAPESYFLQIMEKMKSNTLSVYALPDGSKAEPETGKLTFVDNSIDSKTGTIRLKAVFENKSRRLWPGQFVNITLVLGKLQNVLTVPSQAVQTGANGIFVFVISAENTVELRMIEALFSHDGETVIEKGVSSGEKVVTDGHIRLIPGAVVEIMDGQKSQLSSAQNENKEVR